jgi:hypothetical protein
VDSAAESALPAPAGSLLCFLQLLHSLGVPCWNSDGENDEHIAALAVRIAAHGWSVVDGAATVAAAFSTNSADATGASASITAAVAPSSPSAPSAAPSASSFVYPPVDVVGQDSDFFVLDTRVPHRPSDAVGYVPLDSYSFGQEDERECSGGTMEEDSAAASASATVEGGRGRRVRSVMSITFRRFTTASVCAALRLPSCLLSSFACLCGNDSKLDLMHFHGFTHSPQFRRMLQDSATAAASGGQRTAAVRNVSSKLMRSHGGGEPTSAQIADSVIAFLQSVSQSARTASAGHVRNAMPSVEQQAQHSSTMRQLAAHLFGTESTVPRRPSPPAASPAQSPKGSADGDENQSDGDSAMDVSAPSPCRSPDAELAAAGEASAVDSFRRAQRKYALARFFRSHIVNEAPPAGWSVFDAGFAVALDESAPQLPSTLLTLPSSTVAAAAPTAVLLPTPLLHLYRSTLISPVLLSVLLTRQFVAHFVLGDAVHPCAVHTQTDDGRCWLAADPPSTASGGVAASAVASRTTASPPSSECLSASECASGMRRRIYELIFFGVDARPRPLPPPHRHSRAAASTAAATSNAGLAALPQPFVSSVLPTLHPPSDLTAPVIAPAASVASVSSSVTLHSGPSAVHSTNDEVVVWELLPSAAKSDDADPTEWTAVAVRRADEETLSRAVDAAVQAASAQHLHPPPPLIPPSSALTVEQNRALNESAWLRLCALLDVTADVAGPASSSSSSKATTAAAPPLHLRLLSLYTALAPLSSSFPSLCVLALVHRAVFLHCCRPLLLRRFSAAAVGSSMDARSLSELRRSVIGLHALTLTTAFTAAGYKEAADAESTEAADPLPSAVCFNQAARSVAQLFMECYHTTVYAVQTVRLQAALQAGAMADAGAATTAALLSAEDAPPLLPLSASFQGRLFHRIYVQLMRGEFDEANASKSNRASKRKQPTTTAAAVSSATAASSAASSTGFNASSSSSSSALPAASVAFPSVPPIAGLFSVPLSNALREVDCRVHRRACALITQLLPSRAEQRRAEAHSIYIALQRTVWSSVFGSAATVDTYGPQEPPPLSSLPSSFLLPRLPCIPFLRPPLPFESVAVQDEDEVGVASSAIAPPSQSSNYFSLCCADDSAFSVLSNDSTSDAACECGLHGVQLTDAADDNAEVGSVGSDEESEGVGWSAVGKGKRKKKGRARGKR